MTNRMWWMAFTIICAVAQFGASCNGKVTEQMATEDELRLYLERNKWTYVDVPRELLGAGSIVSISEQDGLRYRGHITDCLPSGVIEIKDTGAAALPQIARQWSFNASALARFVKLVEVKPGFNVVTRVDVTIGAMPHSWAVLDEIRLARWLRENRNRLDPTCRSYLARRDVYVIMEALRLSDLLYTLHRERGADVKLTAENIKGFVDLGADAKWNVTADGKLKIDQPVYIAFQKSQWVSIEDTPGATPPPSAEQLMARYYERKLRGEQ